VPDFCLKRGCLYGNKKRKKKHDTKNAQQSMGQPEKQTADGKGKSNPGEI
jgi:hypothetical protein